MYRKHLPFEKRKNVLSDQTETMNATPALSSLRKYSKEIYFCYILNSPGLLFGHRLDVLIVGVKDNVGHLLD